MRIKRKTFPQSKSYTHVHWDTHQDIGIENKTHTLLHVRNTQTNEKLSVYRGRISEGGIRFSPSSGIKDEYLKDIHPAFIPHHFFK